MPAAVVDTGVLVGMADTNDKHHDAALEIVTCPVGRSPRSMHVTNYVVLETLNWIHSRKRHDTAVETYERLHESAGFELRQAAQADFTRAVERFGTHGGLSVGDATIAAYMTRADIEFLYAFDDDFDGVNGITRLETAENPFS